MKPTLSSNAKKCLQIWLDTATDLTRAAVAALELPGASLSPRLIAKAEQLGRASAAGGLPTPAQMRVCQPLYEVVDRARLAAIAA